MKTMECMQCDRVLFVFHPDTAPAPSDWEAYLDTYAKNVEQLTGVLVVTEGGAPNSAQRKQLSEVYRRTRMVPVAIVCDSAITRGAITAFHWLGMVTMVPFSPSQLDGAFEVVQASASTRAKIRTELRRLSTQIKVFRAG